MTILRITATRGRYLLEVSKIVDLITVIIFDAIIIINGAFGTEFQIIPKYLGRILRVPRIYQFLGSVPALQGAHAIVHTILIILPGIANVACVIFLMMFVYAVIGYDLFGKVAFYNNYNQFTNFRTFGNAFLLLYEIFGLQNWNYVMYDTTHSSPDCDDDPNFDPNVCGFNDREGCLPLNGCGKNMAIPYFISYVVLMSFILANLFLGVVLDGYSECMDKNLVISPHSYQGFIGTILRLSSHGTYAMHLFSMIQRLLHKSSNLNVPPA